MKKFFLLILSLSIFTSCKDVAEIYGGDDLYLIQCKHPNGSVLSYEISDGERLFSYSQRAGVFDFKDTKGLHVIATNCYVTSEKIKQ